MRDARDVLLESDPLCLEVRSNHAWWALLQYRRVAEVAVTVCVGVQAHVRRSDRPELGAERGALPIAEGVVFDTASTDSAEVSQQLRSHPGPARSSRVRSGTVSKLNFASTRRSLEMSRTLGPDGAASDGSILMSKSMAAGTMRKMLMSVGESESELLGSVPDALANKVPPNQLLQLLLIMKRTMIKRFREFFPTTVIDLSLLLVAACVVGAIHGTDWQLPASPGNSVMVLTTLCTLTSATFLRSFSRVRHLASCRRNCCRVCRNHVPVLLS